MTTNHTPGPWMAVKYSTGYVYVIEQSNPDNDICRMSFAHDRVTANAYLVEAAPDMLQALVDAVVAYDKEIDIPWGTIRAAIQKATRN
jgi:hypothetical protein